MESRNVVSILIVILLVLVSLLAGLLSGCLIGGMVGGYFGFVAGATSNPSSSSLPRVEPTVPRPPATPVPVPGMPSYAGVLITDVVPRSPADEAGLRAGDMIISVDRQQLGVGRDLADVILQYRPGDEVTLGVWRRGDTEFVRVRLGEHPEERGRAYLGVYYQPLGMRGYRTPSGD